MQSRSIVISTALAAALACSVDRPPAADRAFGDGWAFPADRVEASYGADGMVSTTDRVASEIGAEVLRRGGNAIDAAVGLRRRQQTCSRCLRHEERTWTTHSIPG